MDPPFLPLFLLALLFSIVAVSPASSVSDPLPAGKIAAPERLWSPGHMAVDTALTLYVVDSYKDRVQKFDRAGAYTGTIPVSRPSAVAAAPDGTLYIGSHRDFSVGRYKNGKRISALGDGNNEFSSIADIAVDPVTADIYVADTKKHTVKIYYSSGIPKATLAGLHLPSSVAVTLDNVYVLDAPLVPASGGAGTTTGARITVFNKAGSIERSIDGSGDNGRIGRPASIAVDRYGNIFVADALKKVVLIYSPAGVYLGRMESAANAIDAPVSLALTPDSRLYISSSETHSIIEAGLAGTAYAAPERLDLISGTGERMAPTALGYTGGTGR